MARRPKRKTARTPAESQKKECHRRNSFADNPDYRRAAELAEIGDYAGAQKALSELKAALTNPQECALLENDRGALAAAQGDLDTARQRFAEALRLDPACAPARKNSGLLDRYPSECVATTQNIHPSSVGPHGRPTRVAILSLLFNWPSTGGGTVHTAETGKFLLRDGYDVQHLYACYPPWGLGNVTESTGVPSVPLQFTPPFWNALTIQRRFREAVDAFQPDYVIITDSWNSKPLLAEAVHGYKYFLRLAALECLCPLNNVRLLYSPETGISACPRQQLATPQVCRECVALRAHQSGSLHQAERTLAGFDGSDYADRLRQAFADAEGILVVNPLIATMVAPFAKEVHVVPSGFDAARFPWPVPAVVATGRKRPTQLFFAGLVDEGMKGFSVLQEAGAKLWRKRQDFEIVATADPPGPVNPFTRYIGWQSQADLPQRLRQADMLVFPTIAEEALGRSAVEAMGCGIPVIASRIGGLPYTVTDGLTGLLFEPGNPDDLASQIETLLDDPALRRRMGDAGRQRFEREFTWETILERHYRRLLRPVAPDLEIVTAPQPYQPSFIERVDHPRLIREAAEFFQLPIPEAERMFHTYRQYSDAQGYGRSLGEWKTLAFEEAYLLMLMMSLTRPPVIVEIGTQMGKSTRRIVDLVSLLGLDAKIVCYDVVNQLLHVTAEEVEFHNQDLTGTFRTDVLDRYTGGLIFLDAHPHALLREAIQGTIEHFGNWSLAIHDCGRGLCNPRMTISLEDEVTSLTGVWERHVLAEAFGIEDPLSTALDRCHTALRQLRIFETQHGLALIVPAGMTGSDPPREALALEPRSAPEPDESVVTAGA
jgi:glycosyltransferase involved in cell wall biosynthesis